MVPTKDAYIVVSEFQASLDSLETAFHTHQLYDHENHPCL